MIKYSEVAGAVGARVARALSPQMELLGFAGEKVAKAEAVAVRGAGRPPGARNKRDEQLAVEVIERFGDPLLHQVAIATMGVAELAIVMGCTQSEAVAEKRLAASVVLPYLHRRMPQAVDLHGAPVVSLTINTGTERNQSVGAVVVVPVGQDEVGQEAQDVDLAE